MLHLALLVGLGPENIRLEEVLGVAVQARGRYLCSPFLDQQFNLVAAVDVLLSRLDREDPELVVHLLKLLPNLWKLPETPGKVSRTY